MKWSEDEISSLSLGWKHFSKKFPYRSYDSWVSKRRSIRALTLKAPPQFTAPQAVSDEDVFEAVVEFQRKISPVGEHPQAEIHIPASEPIILCFPSDWHVGSMGTDHERIIQDVQFMASHPRVYVALGGDPIDNFIKPEYMSASRSQLLQPSVQWDLFRRLVVQLQTSLVWIGSGNHDAWTADLAGIDPLLAFLRDIPVHKMGEGGIVNVKVGSVVYKIYRKHRPRSASKIPTAFLKSQLSSGLPEEFDVGVTEHFHTPALSQEEYRPGTRRFPPLLTTGSYKTADQYSRNLGYHGSAYGVPAVILFPEEKRVIPFLHLRDAVFAIDGV